jgi:DNA-binding MarR family transcriptional regulator
MSPGEAGGSSIADLDLDKVIHERSRLRILAFLASSASGEIGFTELRDALGFTAGNLSVQLKTLEEAGYLKIDKRFVANKSYTGLRLTPKGESALDRLPSRARDHSGVAEKRREDARRCEEGRIEMSVLQLTKVSRVYRKGDNEVRALDEVDLSIEAGEFLAIVGPSGSGKTTMLNILGCLDSPTQRNDRLRRHGPPQARRGRPLGLPPRSHKLRVPVLQPYPRAHGPRERRASPRHSRAR